MQNSPVTTDSIMEAYRRVRQEFPPSPLSKSIFLSELVGHEVFIKWDNKLRTGSFKERGVINFLGSLPIQDRQRGVCAASAGNHAMALACYAAKANIPCTIVMPIWAPLIKVQSTSKFGAQVIMKGSSFDEAYQHAEELSAKTGACFVSAFDDYRIIAGQGTLGVELFDQLNGFDSVIVPIGGGGLISGVASIIKDRDPSIKMIGVQSEYIRKKREAHQNARQNPLAPSTIADGIAVKNIGQKTAPIIKEKVDEIVTVSEHQIAEAIVKLLELEKTVVEGAGAAGVAALLANSIQTESKKSVVVVCGSNIDMDLLYRLIMRDMAKRNRLVRLAVQVPDRPGSLQYVTGIIASQHANVLEVIHDRSFAEMPGNVSISFILEVRDLAHRQELLGALEGGGITAQSYNF